MHQFNLVLRAIAGIGAVWALATAAQAQEVTLKVAHFLPGTSNAQVSMIQPWCDKIAKESNKRMVCQIYPAMQLGGTPPQLFDQAKDGVADIIWTLQTYSAGRFTKSEVFELPWMNNKAEAGSKALWEYTQKYAMDEYKGVHPILMHMHDGTLFHFSSKQPKTLEEMKGLKIRTANRTNAQMISAIGAVPVQMPLPAVPDAIAKGVIDGAAVPWEGVPAIKLDEIAKYHFDVPEGAPRMAGSIFIFGMNQARYDKLPADLKKVIDDNSGLEASGWAGRVTFDEQVPKFKAKAKELGGTFYYMPQSEYQRFVDATKIVEQQWIESADKKGANGAELIKAARELIQKYTK
ncbi:MAG: TRAP transporter substrate-binding protein [Burkholderiales bacterium]|nr:TRAP transporter substrate-binding protein [Burkholderiales bacterium]